MQKKHHVEATFSCVLTTSYGQGQSVVAATPLPPSHHSEHRLIKGPENKEFLLTFSSVVLVCVLAFVLIIALVVDHVLHLFWTYRWYSC